MAKAMGVRIEDMGSGYFVGGIKTDKGRERIIPYPRFLQPIVDQLIAGRAAGTMIDPVPDANNWRKRNYARLMEKLGIVGTTPKSGRHTYSDIQKRRKIDPEIMMDIMRHEDYSTTVEKYHTLTDEDISMLVAAVKDIPSPAMPP